MTKKVYRVYFASKVNKHFPKKQYTQLREALESMTITTQGMRIEIISPNDFGNAAEMRDRHENTTNAINDLLARQDFDALAKADCVVVCCPTGRLGRGTALEIGYKSAIQKETTQCIVGYAPKEEDTLLNPVIARPVIWINSWEKTIDHIRRHIEHVQHGSPHIKVELKKPKKEKK
ncbi:MAG: hypothetical protein Pg6A_19860 [Termitinemataceae bacterium]|nr:MAG: hypothetical protein Pg6A_19860 [Termitinemataceae bacterium]